MKPLIIGQAPSFDGQTNFEGRSGQRLAQLSGLTLEEFLDRFDRTNIFTEFPGRKDGQKGDEFPMNKARLIAVGMYRTAKWFPAEGREVVFIGHRVAAAFGMPHLSPFLWFPIPFGSQVAMSPHPSGTNRWWNDPRNLQNAREFWTALARSSRP